MPSEPNPVQLSREELLALVEQLRLQVAALTQHVATLEAENERLRTENERLRRGNKRQATPFSKGQRVKNPKKPGRKRGQGPFRSRPAPPLEHVEDWVEVPVTEPRCPYCGGPLEPDGAEVVTTTDLPKDPRPTVTAYEVGSPAVAGAAEGFAEFIRTFPRTSVAPALTG